jgi:O-methyltransferase involved in polyketide biosynthesis
VTIDRLDTGVAHPARRYNYWLGGKDHFAADRESGDLLAQSYPAARIAARANRAFLRRTVRHVAESGVRQFLDIGTGLPTADNVHEVAQRVTPGARIVYVDNDPLVMAHARALLTSTPEGETRYVEEDMRHPERILAAQEILDLTEPVALVMVAVAHFLADQAEALGVVRTLLAAFPPGSHLIMTLATTDLLTPPLKAAWDESLRTGRSDVHPRGRAQALEFFRGLQLVDPGLVAIGDWRPDPDDQERPTPVEASLYGAVGVKG